MGRMRILGRHPSSIGVLIAASLAACASGCEPSPASGPVTLPEEAVPYRPALSGGRADIVAQPPTSGRAPFTVERAAAAAGGEARGEDGFGSVVSAVAPLRIDVHADHWPARADDPVLRIGEQRFTQYSFPERGTLRFVVADAGSLTANASAVLELSAADGGDVTLADAWEQLR